VERALRICGFPYFSAYCLLLTDYGPLIPFFLGKGPGKKTPGLVLEEQFHPSLHFVQPALAEPHQAHPLLKNLDGLLQVQVAMLQGVQDFLEAF